MGDNDDRVQGENLPLLWRDSECSPTTNTHACKDSSLICHGHREGETRRDRDRRASERERGREGGREGGRERERERERGGRGEGEGEGESWSLAVREAHPSLRRPSLG